MCTKVRSLQHILKLHYTSIYPFLHVSDNLLPDDDSKIRSQFMYLTTGCTFTLYCVVATGQKLARTSPTGGGRSVGIVRSRTKATEFILSKSEFKLQPVS